MFLLDERTERRDDAGMPDFDVVIAAPANRWKRFWSDDPRSWPPADKTLEWWRREWLSPSFGKWGEFNPAMNMRGLVWREP